MIIEQESISLIQDTPISIKVYEASHEQAHFHKSCIEILFCVKGEAHIRIAYEEFHLKAGEIILIDAEDVHGISSETENLLISFYIDQTAPMFRNENLVNMAFVCHKGEVHPSMELKIDYIHMLLLTMLYSYISPKYAAAEKHNIICHTAQAVMEIIERDFSIFYWMNDPNQFPTDAKERFEHIFIHIYNHVTNPITIEELGKLEHINPNYLSQFLKKTSFLGLRGLRTYIRVYKAELMLLTTNLNASEISYQCGFSDPKYFYKAFKQWYKHTPMEHRKLYRIYMKHAVPNKVYAFPEIEKDLMEWILYYQSELQMKLSGIKKEISI